MIGVNQNALSRDGNGIDGEIAPSEICVQITYKTHLVGVAVIQIFPVIPEGGNLYKL